MLIFQAKNAHVNVSAQEFSPGVASDLNSVAFLFVSTSGEEKSAQFYTAEENGEAVNNFLRGVVSIFLVSMIITFLPTFICLQYTHVHNYHVYAISLPLWVLKQ